MLIADIDFGDRRFDSHAGATSQQEVVDNIRAIHLLDEYRPKPWYFDEQCFRVYRTHSGCRVICTSMCFEDGGYMAFELMQFMNCDPCYMELCRVQKCYRARLTPKPWRTCDPRFNHVCELIHVQGEEYTDPAIEAQLWLHDELTLPSKGIIESRLA